MIVYAISKNEEIGRELFKGSQEECHNYIAKNIVQKDEWWSVNIVEDNGKIVERIIKRPALR